MRGYKERSVGPTRNGQPIGGYSKIVMQNEVRFPANKKLQGALFYDVGNVWGKAGPVHLSDMRAGAGVGILYSTPLGLIRIDYGWKIHRRPGETPGQIHFTIGQTL
ncbi:MAG: BamA/TamA family outer membrane protein [Calditrichota bacterium]